MENLKTFQQMAKELNVKVDALIEIALNEGLIYENGRPTQKAIDEGLLVEVYGSIEDKLQSLG